MATSYQLGISSVDAITLIPEWDYKDPNKQTKSQHRSRAGKLFLYRWNNVRRFEFGLTIVDDTDATVINSWYDTNTQLLFFVNSSTATEVHSVIITNNETPLLQRSKPYPNKYKGKLILEVG